MSNFKFDAATPSLACQWSMPLQIPGSCRGTATHCRKSTTICRCGCSVTDTARLDSLIVSCCKPTALWLVAKVPLGTQHGLLRRTRRTLVKTGPNRIGESRDFSLELFRRTSTSVTTDFTEDRRSGRPFSLDRHGVRSRDEVARHGTAVGAGVLTPFIAPEFFSFLLLVV